MIWCSIMSNNIVTDQFNKKKLQDVCWKEFRKTWQNTISKIVNGGQGEIIQQKK